MLTRSFDSAPEGGSLRTSCAQRAQAGFTLLELVVAIGIFAVLSAMAYGGLNSVLKSRSTVEAAMKKTADLQKAYLRLRNDLQLVNARPARDGYGQPQPALSSTLDGRLEFTRSGWSNPLLQPRSTLERVSYRLDEDDRLVRETWRVLDRAPDSEPVRTALLENIEELQWRFLDDNREWRSEWPQLTQSTQLPQDAPPPRAVELTLRSGEWGELRLLFRLNAATMPAAGAPAPPPGTPPPGTAPPDARP